MKKITKGNDFTLRIAIMKMTEGKGVAFPIPACTDVQVRVFNGVKHITLSYEVDTANDNALLARVEGNRIPVGNYAVEIKGKLFGNDWAISTYPQFAIVSSSPDADTEFGEPIDGGNFVDMGTVIAILPPSVELSNLISDAHGIVEESKKASDIAARAAKDAKSALAAAEHVNAELDDDHVLTVTNREGKSKSIPLGDEFESVEVRVSSAVENLSVSGITISVYYNHGSTPENMTTDENGLLKFRVRKGVYYEVSFPELARATNISPIGYTAVLSSRIIEATYQPYDERTESVTIIVERHKGDALDGWKGFKVLVTIGKEEEKAIETDEDGKAKIAVPWGLTYRVRVEKTDGYYVRFDDYERTLTASINERYVYFNLYEYQTGMFIVTGEGEKITIAEYKERGLTQGDVVGVSLVTGELAQGDGVFTVSLKAFYERSFTTRMWCNINTQFNSIPSNGNNVSDPLYYNGKELSERVMAEALERSLDVPAFDLAKKSAIVIDDKILNGYVPAIGQIRLLNTNISLLYDIFRAVYGESEETEENITAFSTFWTKQAKWSSSQYGATYAWLFTSGPGSNGKSYGYYVLPFFAF